VNSSTTVDAGRFWTEREHQDARENANRHNNNSKAAQA
jgi:hypothetical protein